MGKVVRSMQLGVALMVDERSGGWARSMRKETCFDLLSVDQVAVHQRTFSLTNRSPAAVQDMNDAAVNGEESPKLGTARHSLLNPFLHLNKATCFLGQASKHHS